jgi:hypothetical protein
VDVATAGATLGPAGYTDRLAANVAAMKGREFGRVVHRK